MNPELEKVYERASLDAYTLKQRVAIRLTGGFFHLLISLIGRTLRFETEGADRLEEVGRGGTPPVFAVWHDRMLSFGYHLRGKGVVFMISLSRDGEYLALAMNKLGFGVVRGSSKHGGKEALAEMVEVSRAGAPCLFTVDGPRGPRYEAKVGACVLSKRTGAPIIPFIIEAGSYWTVNSWDRLQIPKPFSRAKVFFGDPIVVNADAEREEVDAKRVEMQSALDSLVEKGRLWRAGLR